MKRDLVYTTGELPTRPFDATRFLTPSPHQNRCRRPRVEKVGLAADAIGKLAENLDRRTDEISAGLTRFSNSGLKEFAAFAVDGRRTLAEVNKAIKDIDKHPTRLLFGR